MIFCCIFYAYNASIALDPFLTLLWSSSDTTIFTINLLAQISTILLTELTNRVCEDLRWSRGSRDKGIPMATFLILGISISPFGLLSILAQSVSFIFNGRRMLNFQWLAFQRCLKISLLVPTSSCRFLLFILRSFLVFILLLNISVRDSCRPSSIVTFQMPGGVMDFVSTFNASDSVSRIAAVTAVGILNGQGSMLVSHPQFVKAPTNNSNMISYYVLQPVTLDLDDVTPFNWTKETSGYLTLARTPIYQLDLEFQEQKRWDLENCRTYGWGPAQLIICARDISDGNQTSVSLGK